MHVKSTFLNADLEENFYIILPLGFEKKGERHIVLIFRKAFYCMCQPPITWNSNSNESLGTLNFESVNYSMSLTRGYKKNRIW